MTFLLHGRWHIYCWRTSSQASPRGLSTQRECGTAAVCKHVLVVWAPDNGQAMPMSSECDNFMHGRSVLCFLYLYAACPGFDTCMTPCSIPASWAAVVCIGLYSPGTQQGQALVSASTDTSMRVTSYANTRQFLVGYSDKCSCFGNIAHMSITQNTE